ncbi:hypothetical protein DPMN_143760 [Dreissena polymorpha]|uniref:Uncharacterized protein n=1 Tax=Dreissena polymorpha TaxID=45954 RepID=A0A9D4JNI6_DREPO|nr:hypothetical protein DPMN_143760 [Dreissena polymorpha]
MQTCHLAVPEKHLLPLVLGDALAVKLQLDDDEQLVMVAADVCQVIVLDGLCRCSVLAWIICWLLAISRNITHLSFASP